MTPSLPPEQSSEHKQNSQPQADAGVPLSPETPNQTEAPFPTAKENVTLDEMMRTLRENEREKDERGEMVTRDDGSTARKVRRRKRRSEQKEKKKAEKNSKKSLLIKASLLVGSFLSLLMGMLFVLVYNNSESYEEKLEGKAEEWIGADVDLKSHKVLPGSVTAKTIDFKWPENSYVSDLSLKKVLGDIYFRSLFGARVGGPALGGKTGVMNLRFPESAGDFFSIPDPSDYPFDFSRYYCESLDVNFGDKGQLAIQGTEVSLRHLKNEGFRTTLSGGSFNLKGWQNFPIQNGLVRFPDGEVKLDPLRLKNPLDPSHGGVSALIVSGTIPLKNNEQAQLDLELKQFPFQVIVGDDMGSFFAGAIRDTKDGIALYTSGRDSLDAVVLPFRGDRFTFKRFPVVTNLKKILFEDEDEELIFDSDISGLFRWSPRGASMENLEMANKNIRLEGGVVISAEGKIRGKITLWISMGYINDKPRLKNHPAFARRGGEGNGYAIIDVKLMGTTKLPDDDFGKTIGITPLRDRAQNKAGKSASELWQELGAE